MPVTPTQTSKLVRWALDFETTGLGPKAGPVELALIQLQDDFLPRAGAERFETLVRPPRGSVHSKAAYRTHKIRPRLLKSAPEVGEVRTRLVDFLGRNLEQGQKVQLVGHNVADFDVPFLQRMLGEETYSKHFTSDVVDTQVLARKAMRNPKFRGLWTGAGMQEVAAGLGLGPAGVMHRAGPDAERVAYVANRLWGGALQETVQLEGAVAKTVTAARASPVKWGKWAGMGAAAAALYALTRNNASPPEQRIEGLRLPTSEHDQVHGVRHSMGVRGDPFGSGRDIIRQLRQESGLPWIESSTLGFLEEQKIRERYEAEADIRGFQRNSVMSADAATQRSIVSRLAAVNDVEAVNRTIVDPRNRVRGRVDLLLKGGIPVEVKTVASSGALRALRQAKESALSQINFDIVATGAPYGYVVYGSREGGDDFKAFRVDADLARYTQDVSRLRGGIAPLGPDVVDETYGIGTLLDSIWNYAQQGSYPDTPLVGPFRGMAASPFFEAPAVKPLGDYNRRLVREFRAPKGFIVQRLHEDAQMSKVPSQRSRLGFHPSGRFHERVKGPQSPVGSRRERSGA